MNNLDNCPHCGEEDWDGYECETCGFADDDIDTDVTLPCPNCKKPMPHWATTCIKCWHKLNKTVDL